LNAATARLKVDLPYLDPVRVLAPVVRPPSRQTKIQEPRAEHRMDGDGARILSRNHVQDQCADDHEQGEQLHGKIACEHRLYALTGEIAGHPIDDAESDQNGALCLAADRDRWRYVDSHRCQKRHAGKEERGAERPRQDGR
jgi:hypothetical protein